MSFILDAIKKSENERQRAKQADAHSLQSELRYRGARQSAAGKSLLLLLAVAIIAGAIWWFWPPMYAQLVQLRAEGVGAATVNQPAVTKAQAKADNTIQTTTKQDNVYYDAEDELPPRHLIKELWELPADYQETIPEFEFSFHFYSKEPAKRSTVINGRTMREGQMVSTQVKLRVITSSGVIMHSRGRFFHINVVEKW